MQVESVEVKKSLLDASVNFLCKGDYPGYLEARYVRRAADYFICYLSSQSGCQQACRFCHLTATRQTELEDADLHAFEQQADIVLNYYDSLNQPATKVYYNWMSRGEALANPYLTREKDYSILQMLAHKAMDRNLFPKFAISTIMPTCVKGKKLTDLFPVIHPDFYYSIYSTNQDFRKKWMNHALPVNEALDMLTEWQISTRKIVKLHWAFIENENDAVHDVIEICNAVNARKLRVDINLVRYNPHSEKLGKEAPEEAIKRNVEVLQTLLPKETKIKIIEKVGYDVNASCGMFYRAN